MTDSAGYSRTPLAKKLGLEEGSTVLLVGAPDGFASRLEPLPPGTRLTVDRPLTHDVEVILFFCTSQAGLDRELLPLARRLTPAGGLWIAWPKKSLGHPTDLDFSRVQAAGLALGLVDNKVCAIDEVFSGLRFVVRVENRAAWAAGDRP